jgi:hypothetical protein
MGGYGCSRCGFVRDFDTPEPNLDPIGRVVVLEDETTTA